MGKITVSGWVVIFTAALLMGAGCMPQLDTTEEGSIDSAGLSVPQLVYLNGKGYDVETYYLPRVVDCENPRAPMEAMKAQAVAARTWFTLNTAGRRYPSTSNSTSSQVYSCPANNYGRNVSANAVAAVAATRGEMALWNGKVTAGFFVAGALRDDDTCRNGSDPTGTEHFVTYNFGHTDRAVRSSTIGSMTNPANRGCFSQNMANCLASTTSYDYKALLRYFYGSDIQIATFGSYSVSDALVDLLQTTDALDATCFSTLFYRPVPLNGCLQSGAGKTWFQCTTTNKFVAVDTDASGTPIGDTEACSVTWSL